MSDEQRVHPALLMGKKRHEVPPNPPRERKPPPKPNKDKRPMFTVPMFSLNGAIHQEQVPDMWHQLWSMIYEKNRHVHLHWRDQAGTLYIHCWNCGPKSRCHEKENRTVCTGMDPSSEDYRFGPGEMFGEWIPVVGEVDLTNLQEKFNG